MGSQSESLLCIDGIKGDPKLRFLLFVNKIDYKKGSVGGQMLVFLRKVLQSQA